MGYHRPWRYIEISQTRLREGLDQVVILGAGFRYAHTRIAGIEQTQVFESLRHAGGQNKLAKKVIDPLPHRHLCPEVDFDARRSASAC